LNKLIGNNDGVLVWDGEEFADSCSEIHLEYTHILHCKAKDTNGNWHDAKINLDLRIFNRYGMILYTDY